MAINNILNAVRGLKKKGASRWVCLCPVHNEKTPSCAITETKDGPVLIHCFGCGAGAMEIIGALGLEPSELFPERFEQSYDRSKRPELLFSDRQLLKAIEFESLVVMACAQAIARGGKLSESDVKRVSLAHQRIEKAVNYQRDVENQWEKRNREHQYRQELKSEFMEFGNVTGY